jgi:hypothetical protein
MGVKTMSLRPLQKELSEKEKAIYLLLNLHN